MSSAAGKPKTPTAKKKLTGTYRPGESNKYEPMLPASLPDRPPWVDEDPDTAAIFDQVVEYCRYMGIHTKVDGIGVSLLAEQLVQYLQLRAVIREEGMMIKHVATNGSEVTKVHPALAQMNAQFGALLRMLREYGLTASSRANVSAAPEQEINSFDDFMNG